MLRAVDNQRALRTMINRFFKIITTLILVGVSACGNNGGDISLVTTNTTDTTTIDSSSRDVSGNTGTAVSISLGSVIFDSIDYEGDVDCFSVKFVGSNQYNLDLPGSASGAGTLEDPFLEDLGELRIINYRCTTISTTDISSIGASSNSSDTTVPVSYPNIEGAAAVHLIEDQNFIIFKGIRNGFRKRGSMLDMSAF